MAFGDDPLWSRPRLQVVNDAPLVLRSARLPGPATIPPRPWLYGTQLLRGFVTVLVAPGGTGKSTYAMGVALSLATGRKLFHDHVFARANAAVLNLEDPLDELDRRLAALVIRHRIDETEVDGRLFLHSGEDRPLCMSAIDDDGRTVWHPDEDALIAELRAHDIGLAVVDPFAESQTIDENSNPHMAKAAAAWRRIARATNCAVMLVHHVRKGTVADIDSARGAKSLTDSARVGILMCSMSDEEADTLGIPRTDRLRYVRLDDAKSNMAARAGVAKWFRLDPVEIGNATPDYPNGDTVAAIAPWLPPNPLAGQTDNLNRALDMIGAGVSPGVFYSANRRGGGNRWAGIPLVDCCHLNEAQASNLIADWLKTGLLRETTFTNPDTRKVQSGVVVVDSLRPGDAI